MFQESDQAKVFTVQDSAEIVQKSTGRNWTFDRVYSQAETNG